MCLQDLQLGRGREVGETVLGVPVAGRTLLMKANSNRVALVIAYIPSGAGGFAMLFKSGDAAAPFHTGNDSSTVGGVLRVEDVGNLIMGPIFYDTLGTNIQPCLTEIITQVTAKPIASGDGRNG